LGLVVDDTVHFMSRVQLKLSEGLDLAHAVGASIPEVGRAVISTSLIICAGFGVLTFGSFRPNVFLGGITALIVGLAVFAELFLLPALVSVRGRKPAS
jgi:predicted RND superfamily exporter protein